MMAGRSHGAEGVVDFAGHEPARRFKNAAHGELGDLIGVTAHLVVLAVEGLMARQADLLEAADIDLVVDGFDPLHVHGLPPDELQVLQQPIFFNPLVNHLQPLGHLGMIGSRVMQQVALIVKKSGFFHAWASCRI